MKIILNRYVLAVQNLERSLAYYNQVLGFTTTFHDQGWGFVRRDNVVLMLGECTDSPPASQLGDHSYFAYWEVDDVEACYREFSNNGAKMRTELQTQPWGMKEFALETIDGHRLMVGQQV